MLFAAATAGRTALLSAALQCEAAPDATDRLHGRTALIAACDGQQLETVRVLLDHSGPQHKVVPHLVCFLGAPFQKGV